MIKQQEFEETINRVKEMSDFRDEVELMTHELIEKNEDVLGLCLMLFSWNFANMRNMLKTFTIHKFREVLEEIEPTFKELENERFETSDFHNLSKKISFIFNKLNPLIQHTGTSKVMYFKNPNLFVMWDTGIRKKWEIKEVDAKTPEGYISFLNLMKKEFSHIEWKNKEISFARAIDIYNFVINQEKIKTKRNSP